MFCEEHLQDRATKKGDVKTISKYRNVENTYIERQNIGGLSHNHHTRQC